MILINCDNSVSISTRGNKEFQIDKGLYVYVGSSGNNPLNRVMRHLYGRDKKKNFWHIDFLTSSCKPISAIVLDKEEKYLANTLSKYFDFVKGFGSTDDKENLSHLFKVNEILQFLFIVRILTEGQGIF